VRAGLTAQALELRHQLARRRIGQLGRHGACFGLQLDQHLVDGLLSEADAAFERGIDLDVEPRFDRPRDELHRDGIHDEPGQHGERGEAQQQPQREARAEHARAIAARHGDQLVHHQPGEQRGERGVERQQQGILLCEERRVAARRGEQEQADGGYRPAHDEELLHRVAPRGSRLSTGAGSCFGERTVKRFQGDSSCSSRLVSALSWKGLGSSAGSRRMRTAAS